MINGRNSQVFFENRDDKAFSALLPVLMDQRQRQLKAWALAAQPDLEAAWSAVAGDASGRRYFRLQQGSESVIAVDSPPATEKNQLFLQLRRMLEAAELPVPALFASDPEQGFFLLQDFGDRLLLQELQEQGTQGAYEPALALLLQLQAVDPKDGDVPLYSEAVLREEFSRFYEWFCIAFLELQPAPEDAAIVERMGEQLIRSATQQPQVLVHRDYHSRNLLLQADGSLGLIDFQDAVVGPLCYDLVSLLRDCYIRLPAAEVRAVALAYRARLLAAGLPAGADEGVFLRWFDWIGLQRHIKVLGNFTRLALRDGKPGYLGDIPLVLAYIAEVLECYPEFAEFSDWFAARLQPLVDQQEWGASA